MKSLAASTTSGMEAIALAVIHWWAHRHATIYDEIEVAAGRVGTHGFLSFHDVDVGLVLVEAEKYWDRFIKDVGSIPAVHAIWDLSTYNHREFFDRQIATEIGIRLKASAWWKKNLPEIELHKRNMQKVRKVMES